MLSNTTITLNDLAQFVIALVALAGLAISIYNLIERRNDRKPKIKVRITTGYLSYQTHSSEFMLLINFANFGEKSIFVNSFYARYKKKMNLVFTKLDGIVKLPCEIESGRSVDYWYPYNDLILNLEKVGLKGKKRIKFVCTDVLGNEYKSTKVIDIKKTKDFVSKSHP